MCKCTLLVCPDSWSVMFQACLWWCNLYILQDMLLLSTETWYLGGKNLKWPGAITYYRGWTVFKLTIWNLVTSFALTTVLMCLLPFPALSRQRWLSGSGDARLAAADPKADDDGCGEVVSFLPSFALLRGLGWGLVRPLSVVVKEGSVIFCFSLLLSIDLQVWTYISS